jgi:hypothetical protein
VWGDDDELARNDDEFSRERRRSESVGRSNVVDEWSTERVGARFAVSSFAAEDGGKAFPPVGALRSPPPPSHAVGRSIASTSGRGIGLRRRPARQLLHCSPLRFVARSSATPSAGLSVPHKALRAALDAFGRHRHVVVIPARQHRSESLASQSDASPTSEARRRREIGDERFAHVVDPERRSWEGGPESGFARSGGGAASAPPTNAFLRNKGPKGPLVS